MHLSLCLLWLEKGRFPLCLENQIEVEQTQNSDCFWILQQWPLWMCQYQHRLETFQQQKGQKTTRKKIILTTVFQVGFELLSRNDELFKKLSRNDELFSRNIELSRRYLFLFFSFFLFSFLFKDE